MDIPATLRVLRTLQASGLAWMSGVRSRAEVVASMDAHMRTLGLDAAALPRIVHVAGTKGKGSTCAMVEASLRAAGLRTGLFTSPHLVCPTERICINGAPVSRAAYLAEFQATLQQLGGSQGALPPDLPGFNFLLLCAYRLFLRARLDVLVMEVSVGGRLCATNALPEQRVLASGVSLLDMDHTAVLGSTLPAIAAQKAGIFRRGVPACAARPASPAVERVLTDAAAAAGAPLWWASEAALAAACPGGAPPRLALPGRFQAGNAALAAALADLALQRLAGAAVGGADSSSSSSSVGAYSYAGRALPPSILQGLASAAWPGRAQRVPWGAWLTLHLDGAHTALSMGEVGLWFRGGLRAAAGGGRAALVFYCGRDKCSEALLAVLAVAAPWAEVHIVQVADAAAVGGAAAQEGGWGEALGATWLQACRQAAAQGGAAPPAEQVPEGCASWGAWLAREEGGAGGGALAQPPRQPAPVLHATVASALQRIEASAAAAGAPTQVLVTGSLYLVGEALQLVRGGAGGAE